MLPPSPLEIDSRIEQFMAANPPDSLTYMQLFRPAIIRMYVSGYSKALIFKALTEQGLIAISRTAFQRWLSANVDLDKEARAFVERRSAAVSEAGSSAETAPTSTPQKAAQQKGKPGRTRGEAQVAPVPSAAVKASAAAAGGAEAATASTTPETTVKATVESTHGTTVQTPNEEKMKIIADLNAILQKAEARDMGAVSDRALARLRLAERDKAPGDGGG
ncbi:hypothetical protein QTI33_31700 [Variovorax sp. J22P271]|uniref:hypothetical protein n=1 Tax=Variovorax davisae TaxID=3053515 RepID=UPI002576BC18|nr:hypothetical protein [Variovorax sp. J22P271]MDM0036737.1 hypothetical protein [Variovorax sp. J22P271]